MKKYIILLLLALIFCSNLHGQATQVAKIAGETIVKESVPKVVMSKALRKSISVLSEESQVILTNALKKDAKLLSFFERNTKFVSTWDYLRPQMVGDCFDPNFLQILTRANDYGKFSGNKLENYVFKKVTDGYQVLGKSSGDVFAIIRPNRTIEIVSDNADNMFAQLKPLSGCKYIIGNSTYKIDDLGRVAKSTFKVTPDAKSAARKSYLQSQMRKVKTCKREDVAGHLMAVQFGGSSNMINMIPMNKVVNGQSGLYGTAEREISAFLKEGKSVDVEVILEYGVKNLTDRPDWISIIITPENGEKIIRRFMNAS